MADKERKAPKSDFAKSDFAKSVERALKRAYRSACETARMHNTPVVVWKEGKVVMEKP